MASGFQPEGTVGEYTPVDWGKDDRMSVLAGARPDDAIACDPERASIEPKQFPFFEDSEKAWGTLYSLDAHRNRLGQCASAVNHDGSCRYIARFIGCQESGKLADFLDRRKAAERYCVRNSLCYRGRVFRI